MTATFGADSWRIALPSGSATSSVLPMSRRCNGILNLDDADMQQILDVSPSTWAKMRREEFNISPQVRKLCRLALWFNDEGLDPYTHIGMN